ncbi:hypothetical protein [Thermocoleostomius sinensis]|uniref:Uncharacterized protein n=1 Tax=Thermocoleostomius sinensis A174 TaxID=2016057 RepID=A0A9E9C6B1_9CYAN|nr:hypothetical protein [Thermocoleostomius sinensis]WAL62086.1 hypothetical protein OXH18_08900 [Thermocoleostomius sinensis A174]
MRSSEWWKALAALGLEFWLPLPLLGVLFWLGGGTVINYAIEQPQETVAQLQANSQLETKIPIAIVSIEAEIHRNQGFSKVEVQTINPNLKKLEYEFRTLEFSQVEAAIAQELGLTPDQVRPLIRYEIKR